MPPLCNSAMTEPLHTSAGHSRFGYERALEDLFYTEFKLRPVSSQLKAGVLVVFCK